jgi:carbon-monoxide dehydrogenase small subunit
MILTAKALLEDNPRPSREEITAYLRGNICRCTGYLPIIDAILSVAEDARVAEPIVVSGRSTDASRH